MLARSLGVVVGLVVVSLGSAGAQAGADIPLTSGKLFFDAHATLGAFTGVTSTVTGNLVRSGTLSETHGWVEAPSKSLTTDNGHRDRDMAGSLEIDKYPVIRFDLDSLTAGETHGDSTAVTLRGHFTLHGQTRAASVPGFVWMSGTGARFRGAVPVNVKEYGVGGLSKMLGILKMNEMITVRMDVQFGTL